MEGSAANASQEDLLTASDRAFDAFELDDWRQAFAAHARIGEPRPEDRRGVREQADVSLADTQTLTELRAGNAAYEARFGHVFLIRASGLSAEQMLAALRQRLTNPQELEVRIAAEQQREITRLRLLELTR
jgi:OHCU decarboxylase